MSSWWRKLLTKSSKADVSADDKAPSPRWLTASDNRFGVPVLDFSAAVADLTAVSKDPECAAQLVAWKTATGDELEVDDILDQTPVSVNLEFTSVDPLPDGLAYTPAAMADKWVIAVRGPHLVFARSWSGSVELVASFTMADGVLRVHELRAGPQCAISTLGELEATCSWLLRTHALAEMLPLPVHKAGAELLEGQPLTAFSMYGRHAVCATTVWRPDPPERPLRSDSRVMQAVRGGDEDELRRLVAAGHSLESPSPTLGLRPLAVAIAAGNVQGISTLIELGADVNATDDRGNFALGQALVHDAPVAVLQQLLDAGAELGQVNGDGFGVLHAIAETNRARDLEFFVARGCALELRTHRGHTPLHIAAALGHDETARALLQAGADRHSDSPGGTAAEIARAQGHTALADQLSA